MPLPLRGLLRAKEAAPHDPGGKREAAERGGKFEGALGALRQLFGQGDAGAAEAQIDEPDLVRAPRLGAQPPQQGDACRGAPLSLL